MPLSPNACWQCEATPRLNQLRLFDLEDPGEPADTPCAGSDWPYVETSHCGRPGFWKQRTPAVFGGRIGVGPLVVMPDTNILIEIRERLEDVEHGAGLVGGPLWSSHDDPVDSLRDLVQLWWWRDMRFLVDPVHLSDSKKPLSEDRKRAREDAVRELGRDFFERGRHEAIMRDNALPMDQPCALHALPITNHSARPERVQDCRWPKGDLDRQLVEAAYREGCHVFLTTDRDILRSHETLHRHGLAIMTPTQLLDDLDCSGELDAPLDTYIAPDLSVLARLYSGFGDT